MKIINLKIIVNTGRFPYLPFVPVSLTNVYIIVMGEVLMYRNFYKYLAKLISFNLEKEGLHSWSLADIIHVDLHINGLKIFCLFQN